MSPGRGAIPWQDLNGEGRLGIWKQTSLACDKERGEGTSLHGRAESATHNSTAYLVVNWKMYLNPSRDA